MLVGSEQSPPVTTGQQSIEYVDNFQYFGSYISLIGDAEVDTRTRLYSGQGSMYVYQLCQIKYGPAIQSVQPLLHLYKSAVILAAIYAADTWKGTTKFHMLDVFHHRCLRTILGIS